MRRTARSDTPARPTRWPGPADRLGQLGVAAGVGTVLSAMAVNGLQVGGVLVLAGEPGFTWTLDALALLGLGAAGIVHSLARRGRPGRWPVGLLLVLLPTVLLGMPGLLR